MRLQSQGPLVGVRVLEICEGQAGPYCGIVLSDLGAEVIKIENMQGDYTRKLGPFKNGESAYFISYNRGKKGIALEIGTKMGQEIVLELAAKCDILIENLEPGEIHRLGLDYESVQKFNPSIIYGSVSCFGRTGPLSKYPGNDIVAEAMGGHTFANGHPDGPPQPLGIALSDYGGGAELAWGTLCAYLRKIITGHGQYVDVSVADKNISLAESGLPFATMANKARQRSSGHSPTNAPYGVFLASDGAYALGTGNSDMWGKVARVVGKPELHKADGWATNADRGINYRTHMIPMLNEWGRDKKRDEIVSLMQEAYVPCGSCLTHKEIIKDNHYRMRETIVDIEQPRAGKVTVASAFAGKMTDTRPSVQGSAPLLGEHNDEVLMSILQYTREEIEKLYEQKVMVKNLVPEQPR